jgi:imidazole glycerol-phosphate synthase subunit HisF
MKRIRLIPRLDIKGPNLIKGIQMEGLRKLGDPNKFALKYYEEGACELIYIDTVASLYNRNNIIEIVKKTAKDIYIPLTVGGGVRSIEDIRRLLRSGADKVAINTAAIKKPDLIKEAAEVFGSQCIVVSIEAKKNSSDKWEAYTDTGRERTGVDVLDWASKAVQLGAGELLITSVDREGTKKGFDVQLIRSVTSRVPIPVIACGGAGKPEDIVNVIIEGHADAVAAASIFHYGLFSIVDVESALRNKGILTHQDGEIIYSEIGSYN